MFAELGRAAEARDIFESFAVNGFAEVPVNDEWVFGMALLSEVAEFLRDSARAETLYELLLPYAGRNGVSAPDGCTGSVSRNLGKLAATMSRLDDAAEHFEAALQMNARIGARPWLAHTQHDYARLLIERGLPDDAERARALLGPCLDTYSALGMSTAAMKAAELRNGLPAPSRS